MKIALESLGCSKNLVDAEIMLGMLNKDGHQLVGDCQDADVVIVNTCGFIEDAKQESIDSIVRYAELKNEGIIKYLLVSGCLAQRYTEELLESIPEIDAIVGTGSYDKITEVVDNLPEDKEKVIRMDDINFSFDETLPRYVSTPPYLAYLKIGEGCDNNCTYCIIPKLRGKYRSRDIEELIKEAKTLKENGVKELVVIAQDTTVYGRDLYGKPALAELLERLAKLEFDWIRVLYSYPEGISEEIVDVVAKYDNICSYFDIPMQHASNRILKLMNRKTSREELKSKVEMIRSKISDAVIRTTFIVGFPGETDEDFEELMEFVEEMQLDRMGAFKYSREEGTPADLLPNHVDEDTKKERLERLMMLQQGISEERNQENLGKTLKVLIEDRVDEILFIGRSQKDAEDIDSVVYVETSEDLQIGEMVDVTVEIAYEYDLKGKLAQ
ncbi:SSU ribosomal protein S12P methylthiotransferase [Peptostreptococcus russellii]|uniref:Ribosomal protein uS12 methylthiotransferase RimO n=1 Tax=Peptostreptococcus russellii TaxID=215200 RepID=A0A1H8EEV5_9FIRM|nr:30S ribosomal protein S12 methylthiotransferase RimO [Peptostreptococcus russellii]SEN18032.1 SSU ribosomal protein S12P methylthiotransferase [Peptostreptococcus russellii]